MTVIFTHVALAVSIITFCIKNFFLHLWQTKCINKKTPSGSFRLGPHVMKNSLGCLSRKMIYKRKQIPTIFLRTFLGGALQTSSTSETTIFQKLFQISTNHIDETIFLKSIPFMKL